MLDKVVSICIKYFDDSSARSKFFFLLRVNRCSIIIFNAISDIHLCIFPDSLVCSVWHLYETQFFIFPVHFNQINIYSLIFQ